MDFILIVRIILSKSFGVINMRPLFILSLFMIISGCDVSVPCSERATTYYPKKEEGFTVFSISNSSFLNLIKFVSLGV